jgi:hypothetical protein
LEAPGKVAETTRWGGRASVKSSACGQTPASFSLSNTKGRPWAAEVENTAEDIKFLGKISGNAGVGKLRQAFAFYSPIKSLRPVRNIVKPYSEMRRGRLSLHNLTLYFPL